MYVIEWDFLPAPNRESEFVDAYGPNGEWVALFRKANGYVGTELIALSEKPGWFRTIDRWRSEQVYFEFRRRYADEYSRLDALCESLTANEVQVVQSSDRI